MRRPTLYADTVSPLLVEGGARRVERAELARVLDGASGEIAEMLRRLDAEDLDVVGAQGELVSWQ